MIQTGDYGANVGNIKLTLDSATKQVLSYTNVNVPRTTTDDATLIATYPSLAAVQRTVQAALANAAVLGSKTIGKVSADITTAYVNGNRDDRLSESTLGNLVADALQNELSPAALGGAQIGVVNPGGLRAELLYGTDGTITYAAANSVLPFVNNLWTLSLTGAQFKGVLEQMWQPSTSSRPFLNLGLSKNVTYTIDPDAAKGSHISSITIDGKPYDPTASYRIGTFSFLGTGGDNFTTFTQATNVKDTGLVDRDAWIDYLTKNSPVSPSFARRGTVITSIPSAVKGGTSVSFGVSKLDLTSLGSPANTSVSASIGSTQLGSFSVRAGAANISVTIPATIAGAQTLTLVAAPSGTTISIPLTVTRPLKVGSITLRPEAVPAGKAVAVTLSGWEPKVPVSITLDGTVVGTITTDARGNGVGYGTVPRSTTIGAHPVGATLSDGGSASTQVRVGAACVLWPGANATFAQLLNYLYAFLQGRAC